MKLTTKQLKQIIKEELQSLLSESYEIQQMMHLISGEDLKTALEGLNQLVVGGIAEMLGIKILDLMGNDEANYYLKKLREWFLNVMNLYARYHHEKVDIDLDSLTEGDIMEYAHDIKAIIEGYWYFLTDWDAEAGYDSKLLNKKIWQATDNWSSSYAGDVLLQISDGNKIYGSDYYGHPARTPKPGEDSFVTAFFETQKWLTSILSMMKEDPIFEHLLRELQ
jgi:hypothetical protein